MILAAGCWLLATGYWPAASRQQLAANSQRPTAKKSKRKHEILQNHNGLNSNNAIIQHQTGSMPAENQREDHYLRGICAIPYDDKVG